MSKFFYFFLLNLLLFSHKHQFDARLLDLRTLDKIRLKPEDLELNVIEKLPKLQKRSTSDIETSCQRKIKEKGFRLKRQLASHEKLRPGLAFLQDLRKYSYPNININKLDRAKLEHYNLDSYIERVLPKTMHEWKDEPITEDFRAKMRKKRAYLTFQIPLDDENPVRYLDYTNSQMPFNEGKPRTKKVKDKNDEITDEISDKEKFGSENRSDLDIKKPKRAERTMRRHSEVFLWPPMRNFEIPQDDPLLEYSRVRRFLDHERAKKRIRAPTTLEVKEAAMSRVLDPNLNLDGILEPHVRKRRDSHSKKHELSFN